MINLSCRYLCRDYDNYERAYNDALKMLKQDSTLEICLYFSRWLTSSIFQEVFITLTLNSKGYLDIDYKAY